MNDLGRTPGNALAKIAIAEVTRRLDQYDAVVRLLDEYTLALTRAAQVIDYATDRELTPKQYEGPMLKLYREHREWIEAHRARGLFPAAPGTKAPVARPKRKQKGWRDT
jgi:hypothetical protein